MSNKPNWQKAEYKDVTDMGGKPTKASGRTWGDKADSKTGEWLVETKYTDSKSYSISINNWDKLEGQAMMSFRKPVLSLHFKDDFNVVILNKDDFLDLINEKKETEESSQG
jgi:hypothetical protein